MIINSLYLILERSLRRLVDFIIVYYLSLTLSSIYFAEYTLVYSTLMVINALQFLGIKVIFQNLIIKKGFISVPLTQNIFILLLLSAAFFTFIFFLVYLNLDISETPLVGFFAVIFVKLTDFSFFYYEAKAKHYIYSKASIVSQLLIIPIKIYIVLMGFWQYLWVPLVMEYILISMILYAYLNFRVYKILKFNKISFDLIYLLLQKSWPYLASSFMVIMYMKLDIFMLNWMLDKYSVAAYSYYINVYNLCLFLPLLLSSITAKMVVKNFIDYYQNDLSLFKFKFISVCSIIFSIITMLAYLVFEKLALSLGYNSYQEYHSLIYYFSGSILFLTLGLFGSRFFHILNIGPNYFKITLYSLVINSVGNIILIPTYGLYGAAVSTLLSQLFVGLISDLLYPKTRNLFFKKLCLA